MASIINHAPVMRKILEQVPLLDTIGLGASSERVKEMLTHRCPLMREVQIRIREAGVTVQGFPVDVPAIGFEFVDANLEDIEQTISFNGTAVDIKAERSDSYAAKSGNKAIAAQKMGDLFANMFVPSYLAVIMDRALVEEVVAATSWRHWTDAKTAYFEVNGDLSATELKKVLWNVRPRQELRLSVSCPNFIYDEDEVPSFDMDTVLLLGENRWFKKSFLMGQSCRDLSVKLPGFSMKDVNVLLRAWMEGEYEKLERLQFFVKPSTWENERDDLFIGLPFEEVERTAEELDNNWHIKNSEGKFATLNQDRQDQWFDEEGQIVLTLWISRGEYPVIKDKIAYFW